uniref:Uncharacterized protein n=1 Tax=Rhizophora mucronata TaxID=61149 RepID=A0A2P2PU85_RHIMU
MLRLEHDSPTLAQILSLAEERVQSGSEKERKMMMMMKKKPIVPLVGDLFFKKKGSSRDSNPLFASLEKLF